MSPQLTVLYAKDAPRVAAFYAATLGLSTLEHEPTHLLLAGPGIELVVHAVPPAWAAAIRIDTPPAVREDTPIKPSFAVPSLEAVRAAAAASGGRLFEAGRAWVWRGQRVLDGIDPEGNVVQFREPAAGAAT
jgi:catechol 2,3-dioxygenase-like lactoylglutathione lyase family enzyme